MNIAIWGIGRKCQELIGKLNNCKIVAFVESYPQQDEFMEIEVCTIRQLVKKQFDLLIISVIKAADIEQIICENYTFVLNKCVFLFLDNIKNKEYFFYQYRLVNQVIEKEYLLECCGWNLELLRYNYKIMQFRDDLSSKEKELFSFAKKKGFLQKLNYSFTEKYFNQTYDVQKASNGMYYISYMERKVYFPKSWNRKKIICYWCNCMMEDDKESPLKTEIDMDNVDNIIVEMTEGVPLWTIKNLAICKKAYVINSCEEWREALRLTFGDSLCKCNIIDDISLIFDYQISCCKIGNKEYLLKKTNDLIQNFSIDKFIISVFYHSNDLEIMEKTLTNNNYYNRVSDGYIYYPYNDDIIGKFNFRKGLLTGFRLKKEKKRNGED